MNLDSSTELSRIIEISQRKMASDVLAVREHQLTDEFQAERSKMKEELTQEFQSEMLVMQQRQMT